MLIARDDAQSVPVLNAPGACGRSLMGDFAWAPAYQSVSPLAARWWLGAVAVPSARVIVPVGVMNVAVAIICLPTLGGTRGPSRGRRGGGLFRVW